MTAITPAAAARPAAIPGPGPLAQALWAVRDTLTIAKRDALIWMRGRAHFGFIVVQPVIFVLMFRYVFGGAIPVRGIRGGYVDFLLPGIIVQAAAFAAFGTAQSVAIEVKYGIIDRLRSLPIARSAVLGGRLIAEGARVMFTVLVVLAVGYAIGFRFSNGAGPAVLVVVLAAVFGAAICLAAACTGLILREPQTVQAFGTIWIFLLTFLSSVFVPIQTMPGWLQAFANNQPFTFVVDTMRALALGGPVEASLWKSIAWLAGFFIVFAPLAVRAYRRDT
jgi:ABC-2 type transport system permease protein/oleandomycin transport system permease protein